MGSIKSMDTINNVLGGELNGKICGKFLIKWNRK